MCRPEPKSRGSTKGQLRRGVIIGGSSVALLVTAFSLTMPHLQARRDELGCDAMCYGTFSSARSFLALIGSSLMGRASDFIGVKGRKVCMVIGTLAVFLGMLVAGSTNSILGLWLSMIPGALLQHNFSIMKALLSDLITDQTPQAETAASVGKLGMAVGVAFMIGPLVGATVIKTFAQANYLGMVFVLLSLVLVLMLPEPHRATTTQRSSTKSSNVLTALMNVHAIRHPGAILLMIVRLLMALAFHVFQTVWTVALSSRFNFGPADYGKFMSFIGLAYALSQGFLAKLLLDVSGADKSNRVRVRTIVGCCVALGVGRYAAYQTTSLVIVYAIFSIIVTALGVVNTIFTADASYLASSDEIGVLYGLLASVESGAGMIGPVLGGALSYIDPVVGPITCVVGLYVGVCSLVAWNYEKRVLARQRTTASKSV